MEIGLLARDAIEILAEQHVELPLAGCAQHAGQPHAVDGAGAGDRFVTVAGDNGQFVASCPGGAIVDLVLAGPLVLQVGTETGVDGCASDHRFGRAMPFFS
ncbi:hypothetical protein XM25_15390 [Devosia sp. H5989]|nr:hypothetical protein XM25_15390 [Devosia sp. H5989]